MLISHPNKPLFEHLANTRKIGLRILEMKKLDFEKFQLQRIRKICDLALALHDIGKSTSYFQDYMTDIQNGVKHPRYENSELKSHSFVSAAIAASIVKAVSNDDADAFITLLVILSHHDDLHDISHYLGVYISNGMGTETFKKQYESIDKKSVQEILDKLGLQYDFENTGLETLKSQVSGICSRHSRYSIKDTLFGFEGYLVINFIFSLLTYSDKTEAILHNSNVSEELLLETIKSPKPIPFEIVDNYTANLEKKATDIFSIRDESSQDVFNSIKNVDIAHKIFSINLPTGSGKTLIALKASLLLRERLKKELGMEAGIIYLLPFTSIIEQNHGIYENILKNLDGYDTSILLKHHYFSENEYVLNHEVLDQDISEHLVETWESEIVTSTFVQFMHSIFTNRNKQLKKFQNIANSIIILDEVQAIPFKYWELVREIFLAMSKTLNCRFILMTATMPLIFSEKNGEILELAKGKKAYFESLDRIDIDYSMIRNTLNLEDFKLFISREIKKYRNDSMLIIANTIKSSIKIFEMVKEALRGTEPETPVFYLSANIVPKARLARIEEIKRTPGKKIVVSTQVVEAGVDLDMDRVYRDFGPIDSINQAAGRCNRNGGNNKGQVVVFNIMDDRLPFAKYVYDPVLLEASIKSIEQTSIVSEKEIWNISERYYNNLLQMASGDEGNLIKEHIIKLEYRKAFDLSENQDAFKLIRDNLRLICVFVEIDKDAGELWKCYESIRLINNGFERKKAFNRIKSRFFDYIINVPAEIPAKYIEVGKEWVVRIPFEMVAALYDNETGFKRIEMLNDYFL